MSRYLAQVRGFAPLALTCFVGLADYNYAVQGFFKLKKFQYMVHFESIYSIFFYDLSGLGKERQKQMTQIFQGFFDGIGQMFRKVVQYNYCIY
jgi:hypothetical protein